MSGAVFPAFLAVCRDLEAVGKNQRVTEGPARFNFRGVDDVMNALHAPMARHKLICVPQVQGRLTEARQTRNGGGMNVVHLRVRFTFYGEDGSSFHAEAWGEGQDSGDKATGKAHSMAYKSALLQAFHIPTEDIPDADRDSTEAAPVPPPTREHKHWTPPVTDKAWLAEWSGEVATAETSGRLAELQSDLLVATRGKRLSPTDANDAMALLREKRADLDKTKAEA